MDLEKKYKEVNEKLDKVSSCFCTAKWLQVSIHLQHGNTHSCHHPQYHKIPLEEIKRDPSALHNTMFKKLQRKMMLEGKRPPECQYCWNIEDNAKGQYSDRIIKSSDDWAIDDLEEVAKMPWDQNVNPRYMEVSFSHACNLGCSYCLPEVSSVLLNELKEYGPSPSNYRFDMYQLEQYDRMPIPPNEDNPYIEAFWRWYPTLKNDLKVFRVTGGEPLINPNTFKLMDHHLENPNPNLDLAFNSNLCIPETNFQKFVEKLEKIEIGKHFKMVQVYASMDGWGKNAEYIRYGSDYELVMKRLRFLLEKFPKLQISIMCTYNVFSVVHFDKFLEDVLALKKDYGINEHHQYWSRFLLDISYLRYPPYFSIEILDKKTYGPIIENCIKFMQDNFHENSGDGFSYFEVNKLKRLYDFFMSVEQRADFHLVKYDFYRTVVEYDKRRGTSFKDSCPEYVSLYDDCKSSKEKLSQDEQLIVKTTNQRMKNFQSGDS